MKVTAAVVSGGHSIHKNHFCVRAEKFVVLNPYRITINAIKYRKLFFIWLGSFCFLAAVSISLDLATISFHKNTVCYFNHLQYCTGYEQKKKVEQNVYVLLSLFIYLIFHRSVAFFISRFSLVGKLIHIYRNKTNCKRRKLCFSATDVKRRLQMLSQQKTQNENKKNQQESDRTFTSPKL